MSCINLTVGYHALHNFTKAYDNVVNYIAAFVGPTPPTNIITNETILTYYIIKQLIRVMEVKNEGNSAVTTHAPQSKIPKP